MPQLDPAGFVPQLFWLAVTFFILFVLMRWLAVPQVGGVIEARRQHLDADLGRAAALKSEAEGVLAAYEQALAAARAEAQTVLRQTSERLAAESAERQRQLAQSLAEQIAAAEQRIAASRDEALAEVRSIAVDVGQSVVEKLTGTRPPEAVMAASVERTLARRPV